MLVDKYRSQIDAIFSKYPPDQRRSAVMPLLYLAQHEYGAISGDVLVEVGELVGLTSTEVASIAGFYTL